MGIQSYTSIIQTVQDTVEDDSTELAALIPKAIFLAEERVYKDIDAKELTDESSIGSSAVSNVSIATSGIETRVSSGIDSDNFLYFKNVYYNGEKLDQVDASYLREINRYEPSAGVSARYYGFIDKPDTIYISPPVSSGKFTFTYNSKAPRLGSSNQTNVITRKFPELLFYATMVEVHRMMKNWETIAVWETPYQTLLQSNLNITRRERTDVGQKHFNVNETQSTTGGQ